MNTYVYPDERALAEAACVLAENVIVKAFRDRRRCLIVLAGGNTPRETYRLLARALVEKEVRTDRILWLFGDERWVPAYDPQSNEGMARECLLLPISAPPSTVISWQAGIGNPVDCAARYAKKARDAMRGQDADLVFLGVGADGHTASLLPDATVHFVGERSVPIGPDIPGFAAAVYSQTRGWRLTLCPGVLNAARTVVFLVAGADKVPALKRARIGDPATPAAWIRGKETVFMATRSALGPEAADYGREIRHA